ncbi:hypothetical protein ACQEU3_16180 [Spirillospora sp. CA-253888]
MRRVVYASLGAMVAFTGGYMVVYLARWEWQRALMAGELLLVSLIVLAAVAGAHRLGRIERRLDALGTALNGAPGNVLGTTPGHAPSHAPGHALNDAPGYVVGAALGHAPDQAPGAASRRASGHAAGGGRGLGAVVRPYGAAPAGAVPEFRWLRPDDGSYRVFIPVLLGAGIVVAGLAALVERVATALGGSVPQGRPPAGLVPPSGGVLAGAPPLPSAPPGRGRGRLVAAAWTAAALLVAAFAVVELAERTQDRPDVPVAAAASTLVLEAETHGETGAATVDPLATRLWEYCRGSTRPYLEHGGVASLGDGRYALVVRPALGEHALRRLTGCLQDAVIDHGRFRVVSVQPPG